MRPLFIKRHSKNIIRPDFTNLNVAKQLPSTIDSVGSRKCWFSPSHLLFPEGLNPLSLLSRSRPMHPSQIRIEDYSYPLPQDRIAIHPVHPRDQARLLVCRGSNIRTSHFHSLAD